MIHASAYLVSMWQSEGMIIERGGKFYDFFGNYVVVGSGYSGGGQAANAVYSVAVSGASSGDITLTVTNPQTGTTETTAAIDFDASAAEVEAALEGLSFIGASDVSASGGDLNTDPVDVEFSGALGLQDITVTITDNTNGTASVSYATEGGSSVDSTAETEWAYATGLLDVRLSEMVIIPGSMAEATNRATNEVTFRAEGTASVVWDGCCHLAVEVDICTTNCTPEEIDS